MKKFEVTYTITGYHTEIMEVEDETTIDEVEDMCYRDFPPIEEYFVEVVELENDKDDEDDEE